MTDSEQKRTKVFVSHSHVDALWLERLMVHMKPLIRDGVVDFWDDSLIQPGTDWRDVIGEAIDSAKEAILLIGADFMASDFVAKDELPPLLEDAEKDGALILPISLSPSRFTRSPSLNRYQSVNPSERPLIGMSIREQEEVFDKTSQSTEAEDERQRAAQEQRPAEEEARRLSVIRSHALLKGYELLKKGLAKLFPFHYD